MTLEQAIDRYTNNAEYERIHGSLQGCLDFRQLAEWLKDYKRLLEQEPCDAINRDMALEKMADYAASGYADSAEDFEEYSRIICQLPSVTQKSGKWNAGQHNDCNVIQIDNRDAERIDITDEYYHEKYDTISCPHCGCSLPSFAVMPFHYCYVCGGQFGDKKITYKTESEE